MRKEITQFLINFIIGVLFANIVELTTGQLLALTFYAWLIHSYIVTCFIWYIDRGVGVRVMIVSISLLNKMNWQVIGFVVGSVGLDSIYIIILLGVDLCIRLYIQRLTSYLNNQKG